MYLYAFLQVCGLQAQVKVRPSKETSHKYLCCVPFPTTLSTCQSSLPHEHFRDVMNVYLQSPQIWPLLYISIQYEA